MVKAHPQTIARLTGVLFLITFITSIAALYLFQPVLDDPEGYITGAGADNRIFLGAFLELLLIVANVGTAVALFPLLRRQSESLTVGYLTARLVECTFIAIGLFSVLAVVSLRHGPAGADAGALAYSLAAIKDWTFILGPGFIVGLGNGLMLGYLMYRSGLVPRRMAMLGLIGGPLICASGIAVLFGVFEQGGTGQGLATIPEFLWELSLGMYLTVKGFKPSAVDALMRQPGPDPAGLSEDGSLSGRETFLPPQPALGT
jgi:Domain of unknown function (DUF4386)